MVSEAVTGVVEPTLRQALYRYLVTLYAKNFGGISSGPAHIRQMAADSLDESRAIAQLDLFTRSTGQALAGKFVLELGAGVGLTIAVARLVLGAKAVGIEPSSREYAGTLQAAAALLQRLDLPPWLVVDSVGEHLPFHDESFDAVISSNVLEHVTDPARVLDEVVRVLKPGGWCQIIVPNYGSWWEGHYGLLWVPYLPRWAGKVYVRAMGRDPAFLDTLQLINFRWLRRILARHDDTIEVVDWGQDVWEERVRQMAFAEWAALGRLKRILKYLHRAHGVSATVWLGRHLHWETPFILTFRKRAG